MRQIWIVMSSLSNNSLFLDYLTATKASKQSSRAACPLSGCHLDPLAKAARLWWRSTAWRRTV